MSGSGIRIKKPSLFPSSIQSGRGVRPRVPGVFPALQFGEQVVSTGIPSLDGYIGGGILLGSILLIKDNFPSKYSSLILKCFLAEGSTYNHYLYIASSPVPSSEFSKQLPSLRKEFSSSSTTNSNANQVESDELKIAWRYKNSSPLPVTLSTRGGIVKGQKGAKFEFSKKCSAEELGATNVYISKTEEFSNNLQPTPPLTLLREISDIAHKFDLTSNAQKCLNNILRISILGCEDSLKDPVFMMGLRSLVQSSNSCAILSVSNLNESAVSIATHYSDAVIELDAILDEKKKGEFGEIDGFCKIVKMRALNGLKPIELPSDLGFSYRKKKITFQELHIPPEGETTGQREGAHSAQASSCGSTIKGKSIDF